MKRRTQTRKKCMGEQKTYSSVSPYFFSALSALQQNRVLIIIIVNLLEANTKGPRLISVICADFVSTLKIERSVSAPKCQLSPAGQSLIQMMMINFISVLSLLAGHVRLTNRGH